MTWIRPSQASNRSGSRSWGHEVCHGQGTLTGVQLRLELDHDSLTFETTFTGFVFVPCS